MKIGNRPLMHKAMQRMDSPPRSLFSLDLLEDPYPHYRKALVESPAYFDEAYRAWVFTRYQDIQAILKNHQVFSSDRPLTTNRNAPGTKFALMGEDPPEHTYHRAHVQRAFTSATLAKLQDWIKNKVDRTLDKFAYTENDIAQELAIPLPIMVIAKMLGIADHRWTDLKRWSGYVVNHPGARTNTHGLRALVEMHAFFRGEIEIRQREPTNDIISVLSAKDTHGRALSIPQMINFCATLLVAGNETTASLIGNMLDILARNPEIWQALRRDRALVGPVIEESLRYESPIQFISRKVAHPASIANVSLEPGELIYICIGAANRDPAAFSNPDVFDPYRKEKGHLAFSHGIHFCVGAILTRMEVEILLNAMLDRYDSLAVAGRGSRFNNIFFRGFEHLPIRLVK